MKEILDQYLKMDGNELSLLKLCNTKTLFTTLSFKTKKHTVQSSHYCARRKKNKVLSKYISV